MQPMKPQPIKAINPDAIWAEHFRRAIVQNEKLPAGPGWLTMEALVGKIKIGAGRVRDYFLAETKAGRVEIFKGSQIRGAKCSPQTWYRPITARRAAARDAAAKPAPAQPRR
jgi:hypothetical protein